MAAFRLALTHNYDNPPTPSMWYAHNYAQRRTHARNYSRNHYTHDYSHNANHEYAHAAPSAVYGHNPYHICQERAIEPAVHAHTSHNTHSEYTHPYRDYLNDYSHNAVITHAHGVSQSRAHTPSNTQRSTHSASHSLAHTSNQRRSHSDTQSVPHVNDIEVNQFTHSNGRAYTHECHYTRQQPSRNRQHPQPDQINQVHSYTATEQGGPTRSRHHSHESRRLRSRNHDMYAFYPEFFQSSEEEESALEDDVRVDLPYTHLHCRGRSNSGREEYSHGRTEHIIRRFEDPPEPCVTDDVSTVGLSYQQRADVCITQGHPTSTGISGSEGGDGMNDGRAGLLLGEGLVREWVRAVGVVAASGTLVTLVVLGFGVYNMLITTLFLLFVLTTVALLIFLLMRRPPCCPCCQDPYDTSASTNGDSSSQTAHIPYLTETHGIVVKKWMKDSPPPYESPPDYSSLSPELIMDAKTLQELVTTSQSQSLPVGVHTSGITTSSSTSCQGRSSSPLCTTPLFSTSFCDTPRSLTPTVMPETKVRAVYESPPSPIFSTHHYPTPTSSYVSSSASTASATVPSAVYGHQQRAPPPTYESLRLYSHEGSRRKDNQ